MALNSVVTDVAAKLARDIQEGSSTRESLGSKTVAFAWTGSGLPVTVADFVATAKTTSLQVPITRVSPSGTPVKVVGEAAAKPLAVGIAAGNLVIQKHSGIGQFSLEALLSSDGLVPAVMAVLGSGALMSYEAAALTVLSTEAGGTASGPTWVAGLLSAQSKVVAAGGRPGLVILSHADYPTVIGELGASAGFVTSPDSPVGQFFGSAIHVSPKAVAGTAYVLDATAVLAVEHESSPLLISDVYSLSSTNEIRLVGDLLAGTAVTSPSLVVKVTKV